MGYKRCFYRFAAVICLAILTNRAGGETLPRLEGETLADTKIVLPDDAKGKISLLVMGFSRKGGEATDAWKQRFKKDFGGNPKYSLYPVAVLEDAPRMIRGMIRGSMKHNVPAADRDHFVILVQGEAKLKKIVGFSASDDAYLLLLDRNGEVQWRGHGILREDGYTPLLDAAKKLAP